MVRAFVGLGANLGDRRGQIGAAVRAIAEIDGVQVSSVSTVYESDPLDAPPPAFLNAVCRLEVEITPTRLLAELNRIELSLGRERSFVGAPRTVDLDILLFGDLVVDDVQLKIPHPRLIDRRFALEPLLELAPDLRDPRTHARLQAALADARGIVRSAGAVTW